MATITELRPLKRRQLCLNVHIMFALTAHFITSNVLYNAISRMV